MVPTYLQPIYVAREKLIVKGYIKKVKEEERRAIPTEIIDLTEKGKQKFAELSRLYPAREI